MVEPNYNGSWGTVTETVGRNSLRGPGFFQWDFSLMKNFHVTERVTSQFRTDIFNLLNRPNFYQLDGGICTGNPNFGKVGQTVADGLGTQVGTGTARQVQLALKLLF